MKPFLRKQYIGMMVTALVFVGVCVFAIISFRVMKQREDRVHEVKETLATYEQNKKIFAEESARLGTLETRIGALEAKRVTDSTTPTLLSSIEALSDKHSVTLSITSVQTPKVDGDVGLYIDFSASGGYDNIKAFTNELLSQETEIEFRRYALYKSDGSTPVAPSVATDTSQTAPVVPANNEWQLLGSIHVISYANQ